MVTGLQAYRQYGLRLREIYRQVFVVMMKFNAAAHTDILARRATLLLALSERWPIVSRHQWLIGLDHHLPEYI